MAAVLTTASIITCAHRTFVDRKGEDKLTVDGNPVVLSGGITSAPGCPDSNSPCTTPAKLDGGTSTKLTIGDNPAVPVLLDSVTVTFPAGNGTVAANQDKLIVG